MTEVYLLRHGATALNRLVPYRLQGRSSNPGLDDQGRAQARCAAEALAGLKFQAVYSSPLLRALETARIVGSPHGLGPIESAELIEASLGRWEGLTWNEVEAREPASFRQFHDQPGRVPYPEGESFLDVQRRAAPALAALAAGHPGERILVVGHNVVNRAVLAGLLGVPIDRARALRQSNGGFNVIRYESGKAEVVTMNACLHLDALAET